MIRTVALTRLVTIVIMSNKTIPKKWQFELIWIGLNSSHHPALFLQVDAAKALLAPTVLSQRQKAEWAAHRTTCENSYT